MAREIWVILLILFFQQALAFKWECVNQGGCTRKMSRRVQIPSKHALILGGEAREYLRTFGGPVKISWDQRH